tara:strand:- start:4573 stop:5175 length:603 start_codon:yes stop_codon:yes gene_type:complete
MKKKMRKFNNGGALSKAQEEYLGGADRTDPYIMARMRRAVPDEPKATPKVDVSEMRDETGKVSTIRRNTETGDLYDTETSTPKVTTKTEVVATKSAPKKETPAAKTESKPESQTKKTTVQEFRESLKAPDMIKPYKKSDISSDKPKDKINLGDIKFESLSKKLREKAGITSYKSGGAVTSSASKRADGIAMRGKTRGKIC